MEVIIKEDESYLISFITEHLKPTEYTYTSIINCIITNLTPFPDYPIKNRLFLCKGTLAKIFETEMIHETQIHSKIKSKLIFATQEGQTDTNLSTPSQPNPPQNPTYKVPKALTLALLQLPTYDGRYDFHKLDYLTKHIYNYLRAFSHRPNGNPSIFTPGSDSLFHLLPYKAIHKDDCTQVVKTLCTLVYIEELDLEDIFQSDSDTDNE